jgi:hypothetical protein
MPSLFLALALVSAPAAEPHVREVPVGIYTKDGGPVQDLKVDEIEVKEDGKRRKVLSIERDSTPAVVALILDSSESMGHEYLSSLVPAAMGFEKGLPESAKLTIWTCGGKVDQAVGFDVEPDAAEATLRRMAVGGPIFALDTMIDASRFLRRQRGARRFVVIVTDRRIQVNKTLIERTYTIIARARVTPMVILVQSSETRGGGFRVGGEAGAWDVETVFEQMADGYGGSYDLVLTPQAAHKLLGQAAADISNQYLIAYESEADKPIRPEVKVKRKDVQVRPGLAEIAN